MAQNIERSHSHYFQEILHFQLQTGLKSGGKQNNHTAKEPGQRRIYLVTK